LLWQLPTRHEEAQLHIDGEGILRQVGTGQEQPMAIGHGALDVQNAGLVSMAAKNGAILTA
jgi:hypothetical protein